MNEEKQKLITSKKQLTSAIFSCVAVLLLIGTGVAASVVNKKEVPTDKATTVTTVQNKEVAQKVTDEKDIRTTIKTENSSTEETTTTDSAPTSYTLPLSTAISRDYNNETPVYNEILGDWRTHSGVDFTASYGDGVKSCAAGTVTNIYEDTIWGTVAEITHSGNIVSKYCGLQSQTLKISKGDTVTAGQCIGYVGEIPCEKTDAKAHIHFEMKQNGTTCDPIELMGLTNDTE